jgi:hypothetical protein
MKKLELSEFAQILKDFEIREGVGTLKDRTLKVEIDQNSKSAIRTPKVETIRTSKVSIKDIRTLKVPFDLNVESLL